MKSNQPTDLVCIKNFDGSLHKVNVDLYLINKYQWFSTLNAEWNQSGS